MQNPKILVIRFSSIGDIVLCTPVLRALKKQLGAEVHMLSKPEYAGFLKNNPYINSLHLLDTTLIKKAIQLKSIGFDFVIDLHNNLRTRIVKSIIQAPDFSFNKLNIEKMQAVNFKLPVLPTIHIVDRYLETLESFGVVNDGKGLDFFIPEEDSTTLLQLNLPHNYFAWAIGGQHKTKQLPSSKIVDIIQRSNFKFILLGGKEDQEEGKKIANQFPEKVINLCGRISLNQSAAVIQNAIALLTNDTGLMHIAAALQKPILSFWGNTIPELGMYPYYGDNKIVNAKFEVRDLPCRPCSKIGYRNCPKGHFNCMMQQDTNEVVHLLNAL